MKQVRAILSYILVALLASMVTMYLSTEPAAENNYNKLDELESLIEEYFIEEADSAAMEDAAAAAMVESLGDKWSYYMTAQDYVDIWSRCTMPTWVSASPLLWQRMGQDLKFSR